MKRKLFSLILALLLLGSLAGAEGYPIAEGAEITVMVANNSITFDYETCYMTKWYEQKTGVHVNWQQIANDVFVEKMNLAFASGDQLDFITALNNGNTAVTTTQVEKYVDQGLILPLTQLIADCAPNLTARLDSEPGWREAITLSDGNIYSVPYFNECFHCRYYGKMFVNTAWLDNLGMEIPATIEEFTDMLRAFRDEDANGNGDPADEIPLTGAIDGYYSRIDTYLISAFIYNDGQDRLMITDDGAVKAVFVDDLFKEGLAWINSLYEEGLIYPDTFVQTRNERNTINAERFESTFGAMTNNHHYIGGGRDTDNGDMSRFLEYVPIAPLVGPNGLQITRCNYFDDFGLAFNTAFIPSTCKDPELVMRWLDLLFTDEGIVMQTRGEYNYTWTDPDEGAIGRDGSAATYKPIELTEDDPYYGNFGWGQTFPQYINAANWHGAQCPDMNEPSGKGAEAYLHYWTAANYEPYAVSIDNVVPPLYYDEAVASELGRLKTDINTYVEECIAKFITGELDIEADWDSYVNTLESIGLEAYLEYVQEAYDDSTFGK